MEINREKLIEMYTVMVRIRVFEERVLKEFTLGNVPGFCHLYIGEEAIASAVCAALKPDDYIMSTHRGHGHVIAKGARTDRMMAELYGKKTGYNKGKGGSMHIANTEIGILGANGVVAGGITTAGGAALSSKLRKSGQVTICFLGDGATNAGRFHEGANLAGAFDLPIVYIVENNGFGISVRFSDICKVKNIADRAISYGFPSVTVDGNDPVAVYEAAGEAVSRARQGQGASMVECKTYRPRGHFIGDPQNYVTKEELKDWVSKDPIPRFRKHLLDGGIATKAEISSIDEMINNEIDDAVKYAQDSPLPDPQDVTADMYA